MRHVRERRYFLCNQWNNVRAIVHAEDERAALLQSESLWKYDGEVFTVVRELQATRDMRLQAFLLS